MIGSSRYYDYQPGKSQIIIGYTFLTRKYWGGNFNRELKGLMLRHAFRFVDTVLFEVGLNNLRSRRAMEKIGGTLTSEVVLDGKPHVVYAITKQSCQL
jgi:RimJ/RimL family protein N-acetyltransferase